ncbi:MAG: hypothetical protein V3R95_08870 [Dehalococcoidia bacterium]
MTTNWLKIALPAVAALVLSLGTASVANAAAAHNAGTVTATAHSPSQDSDDENGDDADDSDDADDDADEDEDADDDDDEDGSTGSAGSGSNINDFEFVTGLCSTEVAPSLTILCEFFTSDGIPEGARHGIAKAIAAHIKHTNPGFFHSFRKALRHDRDAAACEGIEDAEEVDRKLLKRCEKADARSGGSVDRGRDGGGDDDRQNRGRGRGRGRDRGQVDA